VGCISRDFDSPWPNQYGVWIDEWNQTRFADYLTHRWDDSRFLLNRRSIELGRAYGRVDRPRMREQLLSEFEAHNVTCMQAEADRISIDDGVRQLHTSVGESVSARIIVDACGTRPLGLDVDADSEIAWQTAWGERLRVRRAPQELREAFLFMDYRIPPVDSEDWRDLPTFLYSMPFDEDEIFVEETTLAQRPEVPLDVLRQRLHTRLEWLGVEIEETLEVERCRIPMNLPIPEPVDSHIRWGAAAGLIHPASGYMISTMVRRTPKLADAIAEEIANSRSLDERAMRRLRNTVWPPSLRKARDLFTFGLEEVLTMNHQQLGTFFTNFFELPEDLWHSYLDGAAGHREVTAAMFRLFLKSPGDIQARLVKAGFRRPLMLLSSL
jgi:lycopene cyclase-like protein